MIAPPKPPARDELEALIPEARERHRRRRIIEATLIAAVAGVGLGIYALLGGFGQKRTATASPRASAPLCRSSQLTTVPIGFGLGPGDDRDVGGLDMKNVSSLACSLPRTPHVAAYLHGHKLPVRQLPTNRWVPNSRGPVAHVLAPGKRAYVVFRWDNWCRSGNLYAHATLRYDFGGGLVLRESSGLPRCRARGARSTIRVAGPLRPLP